MAAPFCTRCGAAVAEGVRFCVKCGQPVGEAAPPPPPAYEIPPQATMVQPTAVPLDVPLDVPPEKSGMGAGVWVIAVFGLLLVLGGAGLWLFSKRANTAPPDQVATAPSPAPAPVTSVPAPAPSIPTTPEAIPPNPDFAKKDEPPPPTPPKPKPQPVESKPSVVSPPPAPVQPRPVKAASATSGRLHAAVEVAQNGEVVFENLPGARLKFTFDHEAWKPTISREANGTQTLVMRSLKPGIQRSCDVQWEIVQ